MPLQELTQARARSGDLLILFYALKDISVTTEKIAACGNSYGDVVQAEKKSCTLYNSHLAITTCATITTSINRHTPLKDGV